MDPENLYKAREAVESAARGGVVAITPAAVAQKLGCDRAVARELLLHIQQHEALLDVRGYLICPNPGCGEHLALEGSNLADIASAAKALAGQPCPYCDSELAAEDELEVHLNFFCSAVARKVTAPGKDAYEKADGATLPLRELLALISAQKRSVPTGQSEDLKMQHLTEKPLTAPSSWPGSAWSILTESTKAVPAVKYAVGVVGIAAAVAITALLVRDYRAAFVGIPILLLFMVALFVFSLLVKQNSVALRVAAIAFGIAMLAMFLVVLGLIITACFFGVPQHAARILFGQR